MTITEDLEREVQLGGETFHVLPQRQARVIRKLFGEKGVFANLSQLSDAFAGGDGFDAQLRQAGGVAYEVLRVFIPDIMPRWQWDGYASQTAADEDQYDEEADRSPTFPEISGAFKAAVAVNGVEWLNRIKDVIDPKLVKAQINAWAATVAREAQERLQERSTASPNSQPPSGISGLTSSGTNEPTPPNPYAPVSPSE